MFLKKNAYSAQKVSFSIHPCNILYTVSGPVRHEYKPELQALEQHFCIAKFGPAIFNQQIGACYPRSEFVNTYAFVLHIGEDLLQFGISLFVTAGQGERVIKGWHGDKIC